MAVGAGIGPEGSFYRFGDFVVAVKIDGFDGGAGGEQAAQGGMDIGIVPGAGDVGVLPDGEACGFEGFFKQLVF
jgi:hypothetical protein